MTAQRWCFTLNNPTTQITALPVHGRYVSWQLETGESGTPHYQGYLELTQPVRLTPLVRWLPGAHFEKSRGTRDQARDYTRKEESRTDGPWELGDWISGGQGRRTDLLDVKRAVDEGASSIDLWDNHFEPMVKYHKAIQEYKRVKMIQRNWPMKTTLIVGPTGTGKTEFASALPLCKFWKTPSDPWWDGYEQQEVIILDEFYGWLPWALLLRLLDSTPLRVPYKGGFAEITSKQVVITSNSLPISWYNHGLNEEMAALIRRISKIIITTKTYWKICSTLEEACLELAIAQRTQ